MFVMKVDQHTNIAFLHQRFKKSFSLLYKSNKRKISKWFDVPIQGYSERDFLNLINQSLHDYAQGNSIQCAIIYKQDIIGFIGLIKIDNHVHKAELNYWVNSRFLGKGITTATCKKMINYAFDFLMLDKLEIAIDTKNIEYRKTCELLNFELEGILKHAENINGQVINHAHYGLFKSAYVK